MQETIELLWTKSLIFCLLSTLLHPIISDPYEVHHHIDNKNNIDEDIDDDEDD